AWFFLVSHDGFVDTSLVVGAVTKLPAFTHYFFGPAHQFVFVSGPPDNAANYDSHDQQHDDDSDGEQCFEPTGHNGPPFRKLNHRFTQIDVDKKLRNATVKSS